VNHRVALLWAAYVLMVAMSVWGWVKTDRALEQIKAQNCALSGLESVATEFLLRPENNPPPDMAARAADALVILSVTCAEYAD